MQEADHAYTTSPTAHRKQVIQFLCNTMQLEEFALDWLHTSSACRLMCYFKGGANRNMADTTAGMVAAMVAGVATMAGEVAAMVAGLEITKYAKTGVYFPQVALFNKATLDQHTQTVFVSKGQTSWTSSACNGEAVKVRTPNTGEAAKCAWQRWICQQGGWLGRELIRLDLVGGCPEGGAVGAWGGSHFHVHAFVCASSVAKQANAYQGMGSGF
eukprot:1158454-Pelagomonas_calceolata.AAC.24